MEKDYVINRIVTSHEIEGAVKLIPDTYTGLQGRVSLPEHFEKLARYADNFVLTEHGEIKAFVSIYANDFENNIAFITLIACVPNARHVGYGSIIYKYACDFALSRGMKILKLEVARNNENAIKFYYKHNMEIVGRTDNGFIMQKML